tara:strand:+ start:3124 stop:5280 length:2157 start_codon:yes stop_codon:yes gene_type:complete
MTESFFSNLTFSPIISHWYIISFVILFFVFTFYSIINAASGIIYRVLIFVVLIIMISQPSLKIEKRKIEKDIITLVLDKTNSQKITKRDKKVDKVYEDILKEISRFHSLDILEIQIEKEKITTQLGSAENIKNKKIPKKKIQNTKPNRSNVLSVLENNINQIPSKRLSAILILTDGQIHDLNKNKFFDKYNVPVYFLLIGDKAINDKSLSIISKPEFGYLDEESQIIINIKDFLKSNEIKTNILIEQKNRNREIQVSKGINTTIKVDSLEPGENIIKISSKIRPKELSTKNNSKIVKITGIRKKLRVLLISGAPYNGTRVWRNFLKSDPTVELVHMTVLRPPTKNDNTPVNELSLIPFPTKELFEQKLNKFQLIIFDNFEGKNVLNPIYFQNILNFVDEGGAVLEITGPSYNSNFSLFRTEIGKILPGIPSGKVLIGKYKPQLTEIGKIHPVTKDLFLERKNYGSWYQMNKINEIDKESLTLLSGLNNNPLLVIKKVNKGRIAQIYSKNIWLWTKTGNNNGGPYNKLIKNLAHWLMKEPSLEDSKLKVENQIEKKLLISKKFLTEPKLKDIKITIKTPKGNSVERTLKKMSNYNYSETFEYREDGFYIVNDLVNQVVVDTTSENNLELNEVHLTDEYLKNLEFSNFFTKIHWINNDPIPTFKEAKDLNKKNKDKNFLFFLRNNNFTIEGFENKQLLNPMICFLILTVLLYLCWKKEST